MTYFYECRECGQRGEWTLPVELRDYPPDCPECGGHMERDVSAQLRSASIRTPAKFCESTQYDFRWEPEDHKAWEKAHEDFKRPEPRRDFWQQQRERLAQGVI